MHDTLAKTARAMARHGGAQFSIVPGVAHDPTDRVLSIMAGALLERFEAIGASLLSLRRGESVLIAVVDDSAAAARVAPASFQRVVRGLAWELLREVWDGQVIFHEQRRREGVA